MAMKSPITHNTKPVSVKIEGLFVTDIMSRDIISLRESHNLHDVRNLIDRERIRHIPIIDKHYHLVGIVTKRNLLEAQNSLLEEVSDIEREQREKKIPVHQIMTKDVYTIAENSPIDLAARILVENKIGCLPVLNEQQQIVGILTESDFLQLFLDQVNE